MNLPSPTWQQVSVLAIIGCVVAACAYHGQTAVSGLVSVMGAAWTLYQSKPTGGAQ